MSFGHLKYIGTVSQTFSTISGEIQGIYYVTITINKILLQVVELPFLILLKSTAFLCVRTGF